MNYKKNMKKKSFKKVSMVLLIIIVVASSCFCLEEVPVLEVKADIVAVDQKLEIQNLEVNQRYVNPIQSPEEADVGFPSVEVWVITNDQQIDRAVEEYVGEGTYTLTVGFTRDKGPKNGDLIKIDFKVTDEYAKTIARQKRTIIWGGVNATNVTLNST